jgi:hypothetical protein
MSTPRKVPKCAHLARISDGEKNSADQCEDDARQAVVFRTEVLCCG